MTASLGMLTMPFHHPARDHATILFATEVMPRLAQHAGATRAR